MTSSLPSKSNGLNPSSKHPIEDYPTLKKSLSASFSTQSYKPPPDSEPRADSRDEGARNTPSSSVASSPPLYVEVPKLPGAAEAAVAALQYLPTPILVLSSWKTVILANSAMTRLLGLDSKGDDRFPLNDGDCEQMPVNDLLRGQSLSQIGIDMVQSGQRVWVNWEVCKLIYSFHGSLY